MSFGNASSIANAFQNKRVPRRINDALFIGLIALLFAGATALVYGTGGTKYAWPYIVLVPIVIAAARFGPIGGILGGLTGGLLLGPFMPLDVVGGIPQNTSNWHVRLSFFTSIGAFTGLLFLLKHRESQLRIVEARTDKDSGLPNNMALMEALETFRGSAGNRGVLLLLVRVRDLAEVIEVAGAAAPDDLMRELVERLHERFGDSVHAYRFSVSQLMLLRSGPTETPGEFARQVAHCVDEPIELRGVPVHVELVMGSAGGEESDTEPRELIRQARMATFAAAEHQYMHSHYTRALETESAQSIKLLARVRHALDENEFELFYQPKISANDNHVNGCEALIRWRNADGTLVPPGRFMPRVEQSALIDPITRFVVAAACDFARNPEVQPVSINFTVRNLLDRDLAITLARTARRNGIDTRNVEIEITEGTLIRDPVSAQKAIEELREFGFRISLDDFGTGYSSFEYLQLLPLTGLKIDRTFINALESDPRSEKLITCMVDVGHALGLDVVAEGVETEAQVAFLRRIDCDLLQGFYFARPMPQNDYSEWIRQNRELLAG